MKEAWDNNTVLTLLKRLRLLCVGVFLVPVAIIVTSGVLMSIDSNVERYALPGLFLFIYLLAMIASPMVGILGLIILFIRRRAFQVEFRREERKLKRQVLILSAINIMAIVFWVVMFPLVFFSAGASR